MTRLNADPTIRATINEILLRAKMEENVNEELLRARLYHAQAAGWTEAVAEASQRLMMLYRRQRRAGALLGVFEQVSDIHRRIDKVWKIGAGWAYLSVGSPDNAETWLGLAEPLELAPEDEATRLMLLAEVAKSSGRAGSKERARVDLEEALATAESGTGDDARRVALRVRHDLARLTHFLDDDAPTAVPLYESIERDWQALPHAGLDRAITLRNLAEAKMAGAEAGGAAAETALAEAEQHLDTARSLLPSNTGHPVAAELEYVRGRLATRLRLGEPEARVRFERCRTVALATNHLMMAAALLSRPPAPGR